MTEKQHYVYWLYDAGCADPERDGYVGCTANLAVRLHGHLFGKGKGAQDLPADFKHRVLFFGPREEALALELELRPGKNIGWNRYRGGGRSSLGTKQSDEFRQFQAASAKERFAGVPKSPEQREKMRAAALARYVDPTERERTSAAVKKAKKGVDQSGANNSHFGKPHSPAAKAKISQRLKERGGHAGENNPNYRHGRYT